METTFLVMFTFMFLQTFGSSNRHMMMTSSNVTCFERERESLLIFKRSLTDRLNRLSTWTGVECCEWQGVECDVLNGHVVKLDLRNPASFTYKTFYNGNSLGGELSDSLLNLTHLLYLDLSLNNFSGRIPEFLGSFKRLDYLNLSHSGFSGVVPPHLRNLSSLQYLDLANDNLMIKDDLRWVSSLSSLKHLDLSGISIGNHTDWFHPVNMLPYLLTLNLASCHISIPSIKFINLTSLISLDLSLNYINSTIPVWLSNLTSLMHLNLHGNSFHDQIPDFLGTLSSLTSINLSKNLFDTSIPELFWNLSSLVRLDLSQNMFHGSIPQNVNLCILTVLNLWQNKFSGELSSFIGNLSDCMLTSLKYLNLEWNDFNGSMPNKFGEFKKLEQLLLSANELSGPVPPSLGGLSSLRHLKVNSNQLSGSIPASLGSLSRLETLDLNSNQLSGSIPASLGNLLRLEKLDLLQTSKAWMSLTTLWSGFFLKLTSQNLRI
uniref:receptor-like protein EIX2 n=1 Tax=Erigeron canadensis TaxID=72917 RepID=UPI001CB8F85E|nr:receptor-like protein EIX2 [Erigeron canadensis]